MNPRFLILGLLVLLCATNPAFSGIEVQQDYKRDLDFGKYKTYAWVPEEIAEVATLSPTSQDVVDMIKGAVNQDLTSKGLKEVPFTEADMIVIYTLNVQQKQNVVNAGYRFSAPASMGGSGIDRSGNIRTSAASFGNENAFTVYYKEGKLILDFYDRADKKLIWRGTGVKVIDENISDEKRGKNINEGIAKILKNFPPKK